MSIFMNVADRRLDNNIINKTIRRIAKPKKYISDATDNSSRSQKSIRKMFFNQIAFLTGKELISWPGLMSPRKTFTPKTHYSTVKHNEITPSALSTKNLNLQILSLQ